MSNQKTMLAIGAIVVLGALLWWITAATTWNGFSFSFFNTGTTTDEVMEENDINDDEENTTVSTSSSRDVASVASSISGASSFASYFASTGVKSRITGDGPYTIFVPTNGSISLLEPGTISGLSAADKERLVEHHIVAGRVMDIDAVQSGNIEALSGSMLNFEVSARDKTARVNSQFIVETHRASNGVVYVINGVLFPPEQ